MSSSTNVELASVSIDTTGSRPCSPIRKRPKTTQCMCATDDDGAAASGTNRSDTPQQSSTLQSAQPTPEEKYSIFDHEDLFQYILSFVGKHQYRFVGSVNRNFQNAYLSLYPHKTTQLNASTMDMLILCWGEIDTKETSGKKKEKHLQLLWRSAAQFGNIGALTYIDNAFTDKHSWKYELCYKAAEYGQMELLQWAYDFDFFIKKSDRRVCQYAIGSGNLDIFYWAQENKFVWDMNDMGNFRPAAFIAAKKGQLEILKWLHEWGCDLVGVTSSTCYNCCNNAAEGGHLEVLKWLRSIGCNWNKSTLLGAVQHDHVDVVKYMFENGFDKVECVDVGAAVGGSMATLRLLQSLNYRFSEDVIHAAAFYGYLNIVIWAQNHGIRLTSITSYNAAAGGHLDIVKWLYANGCPWGTLSTKYALTDEIYEFAKCNGCPVDEGDPRSYSYLDLNYSIYNCLSKTFIYIYIYIIYIYIYIMNIE